jgi:hypothetical protein
MTDDERLEKILVEQHNSNALSKNSIPEIDPMIRNEANVQLSQESQKHVLKHSLKQQDKQFKK